MEIRAFLLPLPLPGVVCILTVTDAYDYIKIKWLQCRIKVIHHLIVLAQNKRNLRPVRLAAQKSLFAE